MSRIPIYKHLENVRLANAYGGWIYCSNCNKTIAYLCYVTYDSFKFDFTCKCGEIGCVDIAFENIQERSISDKPLEIKNRRLCCPDDNSPLVTFVEKNLNKYNYELVCKPCQKIYKKGDIML